MGSAWTDWLRKTYKNYGNLYPKFMEIFFGIVVQALGSTPTSGRAVQQKVEGRFNHGVNFFDASCHQYGVSLFVWTQQLHHTMTTCAQSTFTFLSATSCKALLLESVPAMAFVEHKSLGTACSNSMPGTAGTVQPLDWTFTWNAIYAEQVWS